MDRTFKRRRGVGERVDTRVPGFMMTETAENYGSPYQPDRFRTQALRVWAFTIAITAVWVAAILLGPLSRAGGWGIDPPIYAFFSYICHQLPARSFHIAGEQFAVCSRCFGVYFGLLAGLLVYPLWRRIDDIEPLPRVWLILSLIPIAFDWSLTVFGIWENTHLSRFVTGLVLGIACATYIIPALVEIKRNLAQKRRVAA